MSTLIPPIGPAPRNRDHSPGSSRAAPGFGMQLLELLGNGGAEVEARDEAEALREEYHLITRLSLGFIDPEALAAKPSGRQPAGPHRLEVEALKRFLRLFLSGRLEEGLQDGPPVEGPKRLSELFAALPEELRNLLRRILSTLDPRLQEDSLSVRPEPRAEPHPRPHPGPPSRDSLPGRP